MKIRPDYAWLMEGRDKVGVGVQSGTDLAELDRYNPSIVLLLAPEFGYADHYGRRAMLRTPHHDKPWWTEPEHWAEEGANNLAIVYPKGVRKYQPINEVWGIEGLGDGEADYRFMGETWTPRFLDALQSQLHARGIPLHPEPDGVQVGLYAPSPGHNYEDNIVGLRYLAPSFRDPRVAFSIEHYYWEPDGGFFDGQWWRGPERLLKVRAKMLELGVDKPVLVGEYNRKVDRSSESDIRAYAGQVKRLHQWFNSLDYVIGGCIFLWCDGDWSNFHDLTVTRTPGLASLLSDGWDRLSEGEWEEQTPMPVDTKISTYVQWAVARLAAAQDPRDSSAFVAHLKGIGADWRLPHEYGLPFLSIVPTPS